MCFIFLVPMPGSSQVRTGASGPRTAGRLDGWYVYLWGWRISSTMIPLLHFHSLSLWSHSFNDRPAYYGLIYNSKPLNSYPKLPLESTGVHAGSETHRLTDGLERVPATFGLRTCFKYWSSLSLGFVIHVAYAVLNWSTSCFLHPD